MIKFLFPKRKGIIQDKPVVTPPTLFTFGAGTAVFEGVKNANEILDKLQAFGGLFWFNNHWLPENMLKIGITGSGAVTWLDQYFQLATGTTLNSYVYTYKMAVGLTANYTWAKRRKFGAMVYLSAATAQNIHIVMGTVTSFTSPDNIGYHIGFKVIDSILYGTVGNSATESTVTLQTISASGSYSLNCIYLPQEECQFYVNTVFKGRLTTSLPYPLLNEAYTLLSAHIYNTEAADKQFRLYEVRAFQEE